MAHKPILAILLAYCLTSCLSTKDVFSELTKTPASLGLPVDSAIHYAKWYDTLYVNQPIISDEEFPKTGEVYRQNASVLPLVVYTEWKDHVAYVLGEDAIEEDIPQLLQSAVNTKINEHHVVYARSNEPGSHGYQLEIEVDSLYAQGPYSSEGFFCVCLNVCNHGQ